ncbi:threonine/homoserine/homoserine lactone efflux protein [Lysobacter niabensis]|uniref:Threonine/homoserine/homoserine lactone efflux protein n=1 Tax=Agrilutibacter niabensis TaxID=380628 RepID=A0ABU1VQT7_9GAMM|nr:LysE family translocator [Lysobacter niabensis]MDR7099849.1 threonine/homoserine/homoserine lactone efflux protein [Lysobacter niabensis]
MVPIEQLLLFAATALVMVLTPGPNMIYLVSRSVSQGPRAGVVSLFGVVCAFLVHMTAAAAGLTALFVAVPLAYDTLKVAGAAYLLYLAWQAVKPGARSPLQPALLPPDSPGRLFRMGFLTCLLNPKAAVLYLSILPQFVDPHRGSVFAQSVLLGSLQIAISFTFNLLIALSAAGLAARFARKPAWMAAQRYLMGSVLGGLAVRMVLEPRRLA